MTCELFQETEHPYNLWNRNTVIYGTEILLFMGPKIWSRFRYNRSNSRDDRDI